MSILTITLIIFIGIILLLLEFFIIPGITLAGVGGFIMIAGGIFCAYYFHSKITGHYVVLATSTALFAIFWIAFKSGTWKNMGLEATIEGRINEAENNDLQVGAQGKSISKLSPIGKAIFNGKLIEARSEGEYIDSNKVIEVLRIEGNRIYVKEKKV